MDNPTVSRYEAAKQSIEAAGGKLISMYSTAANGPGILVIFDMPDPNAAPALSGVVVASGALQNVELKRLWTQEEITSVKRTRTYASVTKWITFMEQMKIFPCEYDLTGSFGRPVQGSTSITS